VISHKMGGIGSSARPDSSSAGAPTAFRSQIGSKMAKHRRAALESASVNSSRLARGVIASGELSVDSIPSTVSASSLKIGVIKRALSGSGNGSGHGVGLAGCSVGKGRGADNSAEDEDDDVPGAASADFRGDTVILFGAGFLDFATTPAVEACEAGVEIAGKFGWSAPMLNPFGPKAPEPTNAAPRARSASSSSAWRWCRPNLFS